MDESTKDKLKGKAKQVIGSVTGDRGEQAEGLHDENKGNLKEDIEKKRAELEDAERRDY